jgi:hypothetical protein
MPGMKASLIMVHDFFFSFFLFVHDFKKCVIELGVQGFY